MQHWLCFRDDAQVVLSLVALAIVGQCSAQSDADVYNFALNLEYLEVSFQCRCQLRACFLAATLRHDFAAHNTLAATQLSIRIRQLLLLQLSPALHVCHPDQRF